MRRNRSDNRKNTYGKCCHKHGLYFYIMNNYNIYAFVLSNYHVGTAIIPKRRDVFHNDDKYTKVVETS